MGGFFCPKIKAKLLLWGEKSANLHLTAEINGGGWERIVMTRNLKSTFLQLLPGRACWSWSEMLCSYPAFDVFDCCYYSNTTALLLVRLCRTRNRRDLTDVLCYWSIFILPNVPHSLPSTGLPFLSSFTPGWAPNCCDAADKTDLCLLHVIIPRAQSLFDSCQLRLGLMRYRCRFIAPAVPRSDSECAALGNEGASFTNLWRCA